MIFGKLFIVLFVALVSSKGATSYKLRRVRELQETENLGDGAEDVSSHDLSSHDAVSEGDEKLSSHDLSDGGEDAEESSHDGSSHDLSDGGEDAEESSHDVGDDYENCKTDELKNIRGIACSNKDVYNTMCDLMKAVDLDYMLASGKFTAFFPTDDAFADIDAVTKSLSEEQIADIVKFHFHEGESIKVKDLECSGLIKMTNGDDSRTKCEDGKRYQKGAGNNALEDLSMLPMIIKNESDMEACNGIVHTIDTVMLPNMEK